MYGQKYLIPLCLLTFSAISHGFEAEFLDNISGSAYVQGVPSDFVRELATHIEDAEHQQWASGLNWEKIQKFYAKRKYVPIWFNGDEPAERARILRDNIVESYLDGLNPGEYHAPAIRYMWNAKRARTKARLELLLTDAFFRYSREVSAGYFYPKSADFDWNLPDQKVNVTRLLENYLISSDPQAFLTDLPPSHEQYKKLKQALAQYREIAKNGGWKGLNRGTVLKLGDQGEQVAVLRKRLQIEGLLVAEKENKAIDVFDASLESAVKKFQALNGHKEDGVVGWFTRRTLNIPVETRIADIKKNMERWRWLPENLGKSYVMVNMAGYELNLVYNNQDVLQMPVVVGKTVRATPTFVDTLEYLEFNPTWKVPPRIAKEKFLPKLQEDPNFIAENHLKVFDGWGSSAKELDSNTINWSHYSEDRWFPFKLVQSPGDHNSLGRIKFMFPNKYRIYLHDSPEKELFDKYVRTFSAGCIRVSDPYALAEKILQQEGDWTREKIQQLVKQGETQTVSLHNKWPVYLLYWTSWVDETGMVNFRKDVYQRNTNIASGIEPDYQRFASLSHTTLF